MVWQLYQIQNGELMRMEGFHLDQPADATEPELIEATRTAGWQSFADTENADAWKAVVIQNGVNSMILRWDDDRQSANAQIRRLLSNLEILLNIHLREAERWNEPFNNLSSAIEESL